MPTDVTFKIQSVKLAAQKAFLAHSLPLFDDLFYGVEADPSLYEIDVPIVSALSFQIFLFHVYGSTIELDNVNYHTLLELKWLAVNYRDESFKYQLICKIEGKKEREIDVELLKMFDDLFTKYTVMEGWADFWRKIETIGGIRDGFRIELMAENRFGITNRLKDVWMKPERIREEGSFEEYSYQTIASTQFELFVSEVEIAKDVGSVVCETIGWHESKIPSVKQFSGICSYVAYNGIVSVSTKEQLIYRKLIDCYLENYYTGSERGDFDKNFVEGEPCVAKFKSDGKWYRGKVISWDNSSDIARVLYVDYGNSDWCWKEDLRKNVLCTGNIPMMSLSVHLEGWNSDVWTVEIYNRIFLDLVDKKLDVMLKKKYTSHPVVGSVEIYSK